MTESQGQTPSHAKWQEYGQRLTRVRERCIVLQELSDRRQGQDKKTELALHAAEAEEQQIIDWMDARMDIRESPCPLCNQQETHNRHCPYEPFWGIRRSYLGALLRSSDADDWNGGDIG